MNKLQWFENLQEMSDEELVIFARQQGLKFSVKEIKKLRIIFKDASISWLFSGIPEEVNTNALKLIGDERFKQLLKIIG